jgi:uncharacterized protein YbgA (DUF1722 family)/uncharacterized protein YbbK (DUF523 family)
MKSSADRPLRVGVSSCLLGAEVRFDGGHKRDGFVADALGAYAEFVAVCPEVEIGLGVPRETLRLERRGGETRLIAPKSGVDHTERMRRFAAARLRDVATLDLDGWVLKKSSPSCGLECVRVSEGAGPAKRDGRGLFAEALAAAFPDLPLEEEGRLNDARIRENFVERLFAHRRLKILFAGRWSIGDLVRFHTREKLALLAHDPGAYAALGRIVATAKGRDRRELAAEYRGRFMRALSRIATPGRHANVLAHVQGYFRERLRSEERAELAELIEDYRRGLVPLIVPLTLVRHYVRTLDVAYVAGQSYLEPHPKELMLRNRV